MKGIELPTDANPVTIVHGDCRTVMATMPAGCVDAIVTDPPYGTKKTTWDHSIDGEVLRECLRVSRGYCLFFYSNTRLAHILSELKQAGAESWVIAWHKPNAMGFERRFAPQWVPVVCAYRGNFPFWGQDLFAAPIVPHKFDHPTPKPVSVVRWLIERATEPGELVFDPFAGSGTTGVAAMQCGRRCVLIEKEADYVELCRKRTADAGLFAGAVA